MASVGADYITPSAFEEYCDHIADGLTTRQAAKAIDKSRANVFKWMSLHATQEQRDHYARCLEFSADSYAEDALEIADDDSLDIGFDDDGKPFVKGENIQRARLRVDTRKWTASKRYPKKYGDKVQVGGDADNPVKLDAKIEIVHVQPE